MPSAIALPEPQHTAKFVLGREGSRVQPVSLYADSLPIDEKTMSVGFVTISTPAIDRDGDSLISDRGRYENYAKNPVVFLDHGEGFQLPIAKSCDPQGKLLIEATPGEVRAACYFAQSLPEAVQVFGLLAEKVLSARSIHFYPIEAEQQPGRPPMGAARKRAFRYTLWDMLEWSWVGIPSNPEAAGKALRDNKWQGEDLCHAVRKSLERHTPRPTAKSVGWRKSLEHSPRLKPEKSMSDPQVTSIQFDESFSAESAAAWCKKFGLESDIVRVEKGWVAKQADHEGAVERMAYQGHKGVSALVVAEAPKLTKAAKATSKDDDEEPDGDEMPEKDAADGDADPDEKEGGDNVPEETEPEKDDDEPEEEKDDEPDQVGDSPLGAQILRAFHDRMKELGDGLQAASGPLENPAVKEFVVEHLQKMTDAMDACKVLHGKSYPDAEPIGADSSDEMPADANPDGKSAKRLRSIFFKGWQRAKAVVKAGVPEKVQKFLTSALAAHTLTKSQRKEAQLLLDEIAVPAPRLVPDEERQLAAMQREARMLKREIASLTPPRR